MNGELLRRAADLARLCEKRAEITHSAFLTPAEAYELAAWAKRAAPCTVLLRGGHPDAERQAAFFLPDWMDEAAFDEAEHLCAIACTARFGAPGHRDWLGGVLARGIGRERLGDILVDGERAWLICLPGVKDFLLLNLERVGRWGVKAREVPLAEVPQGRRALRESSFTVASARLDVVCAGMFSLSRSAAAEAIAAGNVTRNWTACEKPDAAVAAGDVLALHGKGKGVVLEIGETRSRRGRVTVRIGRYV
jgi:RNA-binding protein YlmH